MLFVAFACMPHSGAHLARPGTLLIGNSMTYFNRGPDVFRALDGHRHIVDDITGPGYTLEDHLEDAQRPWRHAWALPFVARDRYDTVVLQESTVRMIGAWERTESDQRGALYFGQLAHAAGARVLLFSAPFREPGMDCFGFVINESMTSSNYSVLATVLRERGIDAEVVPVGAAFAQIAMNERGCDQGEFDALFTPDDHHPSLRGTYLSMTMLYASVHSIDVRTLPDEPTLGPLVSARLRHFAYVALKRHAQSVARRMRR